MAFNRSEKNLQQSSHDRSSIRKNAPLLKPSGDFFYKSVNYRYYHRFIEELISRKKFPKRKGLQKPITVTGSGVYSRYPDLDSKYPFKKPQYSEDEKAGFSNFQSTSLGIEDVLSKVFSFKDKKSVSAGVIFEKHGVLLGERLFISAAPTFKRPYNFIEGKKGESYFNKHHLTKLFSKDEFEAFKEMVRKNPDKASEPLIRLKWLLDGTCKIFIGADNLESRLLAKQYADTLLAELKKASLLTPNYRIQICYYIPEKPELLYKEYTQEEYELDLIEANAIAENPNLKSLHYEDNQFEFLLAVPSDKMQQFLTEEFKGLPLALYLLKNGYEHIYRFIAEKTSFDLNANLNTLPDHSICGEIFAPAIRSGDLALVKTLLKYDFNLSMDAFKNLLFTALKQHLPEIASAMISSKHFKGLESKDINQALILASKINDKALIQLLLNQGADINAMNINGFYETPLMFAAHYGHSEIVEFLLAQGAKTEIKNKNGHTALSIATYRGKIQTVEQLLLHQADVNTVDHQECTPLLLALYCDYEEIASLLLHYKADINQTTAKGNTALHLIAKARNKTKIIANLLENHAAIDAKNNDGLTPLMMAIHFNQIDAVHMLIANGAQLEIKNENNETALDMAIKLKRNVIIEFIKSYTAIQNLWQQAAIESDCENKSIAYQLSRLFYSYANKTFDLKPHKQLASNISCELEKHHDWTLSDCKNYIDEQIINQEINGSDTFAGLLNLIKTLEMKILKQESISYSPSLLQDHSQADIKSGTSIQGFLGKNWGSIYTKELYELIHNLSKPYIPITNRDIDKIKNLVKKGAVLNHPIHGKTIAEWALYVHINDWFSKDWQCVKAIIEAVHEDDKENCKMLQNFFLYNAVLYRQQNMVEYLLDKGALVKNEYITIAELNNDKKILEILNNHDNCNMKSKGIAFKG